MNVKPKSLLFGILVSCMGLFFSQAVLATLTPGTGQNGASTLSGCMMTETFPAPVTSGWIMTDQGYRYACMPSGGVASVNWEEMTYFPAMPVGSSLVVCLSFSYPPGWTVVEQRKDRSRCGYFQGQVFSNNVVILRRDQ